MCLRTSHRFLSALTGSSSVLVAGCVTGLEGGGVAKIRSMQMVVQT